MFYNKLNDDQYQHDPQCNDTGGICQLNMVFTANMNASAWFSLTTKSASNVLYDNSKGSVSLLTQKEYVPPPVRLSPIATEADS